MDRGLSHEIANIYPDLTSEQLETDYQNLRPSDVTRYILKIFDDKELTVEIAQHIIYNLHERFSAFDYNKTSEITDFDIKTELQETKEMFQIVPI